MSVNERISGRAKVAVLGAAAAIAVVAALFIWGGGQSAFATAIEQFQKATTIVCRVSSLAPIAAAGMEIEASGKLYMSAEHGTRFENYGNGILAYVQYTPPEGPVIVVTPLARHYMVIDAQEADDQTRAQARPDEFIRALRQLSAEADRELGPSTIDGVEALGYEISGQALGFGIVPEARSKLWIDSRTYLPVRYLAEVPGLEPRTMLTLVYDQFEWDTALDPQLFEPDIPTDYTRIEAKMPPIDEATMIKGLARFAELSGKYPTKMDLAGIVGELGAAMAARPAGEEDRQTRVQESLAIGSAYAFYQKLAQDGRQPEYFGATVQPGQAEAVLLRWQLNEAHQRVIYGDLRIETVPAD